MTKIILCLIGYGGSGKTSAAKYLSDKYGFTPFTISTVIREYAAEHGLPLTKRAEYAHAHVALLAEYGNDYVPKRALEQPGDRLCVDDLRSPKYAEVFRAAGAKSIAFDCPSATRFEHVRAHPDKVKYPDTLEAFLQSEREDEAVTLGAGLDFATTALMKSADYHVDATGSLEDTLRQLDNIVAVLDS